MGFPLLGNKLFSGSKANLKWKQTEKVNTQRTTTQERRKKACNFNFITAWKLVKRNVKTSLMKIALRTEKSTTTKKNLLQDQKVKISEGIKKNGANRKHKQQEVKSGVK